MNSLNPIFLAFALIVCVYTVSRAWKTFADEEILSITNPMVKLIPFFVIVVAVGIRIYKFGEVPCGVMGDEAMIAINGKSLADYGIDIYGTRFPVHLNAWGQGQQSAY